MATGSSNDALLSGVAKALGLTDTASLGELRPSSLWKLTQRELLEAARLLGLSRVSRLNKEALLARVWEALEKVGALGGEVTPAGERAVVSAEAVTPAGGGTNGGTEEPLDPSDTPGGAAHKFEVGEREEGDLAQLRAEAEASIPWGYGHDRVTAMPVDPDRLYVYWEVTDDAIARARGGLGPGGPGAWLCLRVYDVTGRIFDGTNAHGHFDHHLDRGDRQWFFQVGKPTSQAIVEVGMKSHEGYFVRIARSARVEFPRREPVGWAEPEWLTVQVWDGAVVGAHSAPPGPPGGGPGHVGGGGSGAEPGTAGGGGYAVDGWQSHELMTTDAPGVRRRIWGERVPLGEHEWEERVVWEEVSSWELAEVQEFMSWEGETAISSWQAGPFSYPVDAPEFTRETYTGPTRVYRSGPRVHVVWGPWEVVIRGLGGRAEHRVVSRWEIYRSWTTSAWKESSRTEKTSTAIGSSEMMVGASERVGRSGSELRLMGASERFIMGASELRLRGASERLMMGATENLMRGASERRFMGGSEYRLGGASEERLGGGSERRWGGGSEARLGGASELRLGSGSEIRLGGGGSERRLGGSEERLESSMGWPALQPRPESK